MFEFKLPDLGEGVHEGEILKWYVEPGGTIQEDDPLVDIETDKAAITIPSPRAGKIVSITGGVGDTVLVGNVVVVIDDGSESEVAVASGGRETKAPLAKSSSGATSGATATNRVHKSNSTAGVATAVAIAVPTIVAPAVTTVAPPAPSWGRAVAAPATRRLARELKLDIQQIPPTGPGGRVTPEDVRNFSDQSDAPPAIATPEAQVALEAHEDSEPTTAGTHTIPFLDLEPLPDFTQWGPVESEPLRSIRRKVARKMVTSMIIAPHVAHMDEVDVTLLENLRGLEKERRAGQPGGRLTLLAFVAKAVTAGLKATPVFNASLDPFNEEIIYKKYYNIGIAVDTDRGLVVPVIRDTDRKSILQISVEIEEAAEKAREGELAVADLRGGTFTITNIGALGGTGMVPTINYPEVAILGMSRVQEKPVVLDGEIVIRKMLPLTLAFDHRIVDGADAARFVSDIVRRLSNPNALLVEM